jgi:hypothetical protein
VQVNRFNRNVNGKLEVVIRAPMAKVLETVTAGCDPRSHRVGVVLRGVKGVGKSMTLYAIVCYMRRHCDRFGVTYIPDCRVWQSDGVRMFLLALVATFYADPVSIVGRAAAVAAEKTTEELEKLVESLAKFCRDTLRLPWVLVVDQTNRIADEIRADKYPFSLARTFGGRFVGQPPQFIIKSASTDNEQTNECEAGYDTVDFVQFQRLNDAEFKIATAKVQLTGEQADEVKYWTGLIPLEVAEFVRDYQRLSMPGAAAAAAAGGAGDAFAAALLAYKHAAEMRLKDPHSKFIDDVSLGTTSAKNDAIAKMILRTPVLTKSNPLFDRQL